MSEFPNNIVDELVTRTTAVLTDLTGPVLRRPLRPTDPERSVGIFPVDWNAVEGQMQMGNVGPSLQTYSFRIHLLVKNSNEEEGRALYANDSKKLRTMLYHDQTLKVALGSLTEVVINDHTERLQRWGIRSQRFLNNELSGQFLFLSSTDFWAETQNDHTGG